MPLHPTGRWVVVFRTLAVLAVLGFAGSAAFAHVNARQRGTAGDGRAAPDQAARFNGLPGAGRTCAGTAMRASRELRGLWITTVNNTDWPSRPGLDAATVKAEYLGWLDLAQRLNFNAVFVHVRPSGDAFWPSHFEPWSQWLTGGRDGRSPGWDPLEFMVAETHSRNLEFHAWFNPYRGSQPATVGGAGASAAAAAGLGGDPSPQ
jgi:glycosyl hydrolase family 10